MVGVIDSARKGEAVDRPATTFEPCQDARPSWLQQLELDGALGLLLNDLCTVSYATPSNEVADANLHEIAPAKFAVDGKVEQGSVAKSMLLIQHEADRPDLLRLQRPFCTELSACVPCRALFHRVI
jgi:hypothetical protein